MSSNSRHSVGTVELRRQLLGHARRLLEESGPESISVRQVGKLAGRSAQAIATAFGDRPGLIAALCRQGHIELSDQIFACPTTKNAVYDLLTRLGAYLAWARAHPRLYELMTTTDLNPTTRADDRLRLSYGPLQANLQDTIQRVIDAGTVHSPDVLYLYAQIAAAVHGAALYELELRARGQEGASGDIGVELVANILIAFGADRASTHRAALRARLSTIPPPAGGAVGRG